ncbi:MAG: ABC transporter permease [Synergistaceae bacterium]|jgi:oligopeptide transport system permease protein|nr:ABC transporter permease [Synergistaceae bacterium]
MIKYALKRLLQSIATLLIVAVAVFFMLRLMPEEGYFAEDYDKLTREQIEAALTEMGLRDPLRVQLFNFLKNTLRGDLGTSITVRRYVSIANIIGPKIPYSVCFGLAAIGISLVLGVPLGMLMACFKGRLTDNLGSAYVVFVRAVPAAVCFIFLQLYGSSFFKVPILFSLSRPSSWILPTVCMALGNTAYYAMWMRRYMVDELNKDYVKLARAKGMKNSAVMARHVLRNAFVPMAQLLPASVLLTITGSIYVESLFSIPGMGGLLVTAIQRQDNTLVQALVLIFSCVGILGLFLGDVLMAALDPRIKLERKGGSR